ncbi:MAG: right-handed parallel beta-helix repeat-containing protein, partial [Planctomycetes bacterium]|nr:right-handed parallel beta-helix repeat-containing protein [Planctomycetota bacterium]
MRKHDEIISRQLERLEDRTLLTAFIVDSLNLLATPGVGISVTNADIIGTGTQANPEFDSLIIETVSTNGAGITINLDNISLETIVIESANLVDFDGVGIDINLDNVTGLQTLVIESTDAHGINSAAVDIDLLNTTITNLTVFDSRLDGVHVNADNSVIEHGRIIGNAITAGVGIDAIVLSLSNGAIADGFTIQDNTQISSITEDSILFDFDGTPVDGLRVQDNTFATGSILDLDFLIDGDTFKQAFQITNKSAAGNLLQKFTFDISLTGLEFDIDPITGKPFDPIPATAVTTGFAPPAIVEDRGTLLEIDFTDFDPGEFFEWNIDLDIAAANTSVFGNELIGAIVTLDYSGGQQITGTMVAVPGFPDAARFVTAQGGGGGTGINFDLDSSPLTDLLVDNNVIQGNSGFGIIFDAFLSDIQGTISNNEINAVADDGIAFMLVDSNLTGDIVDNVIGANLNHGISFSPSVDISGKVLSMPVAGQIVVTSFAHGLANGDRIVVAGAAGEDVFGVPIFGADNPANGVFIVDNVTADTFELREPGTNAAVFANSFYKGGGTWFKTPAAGNITNASNPALVDIEISSAAHGLATGDVVTIQHVIGNLTANGTHVVTVTGLNTFKLDGVSGVDNYAPGPLGKSGVWYKTFIVDVRGSLIGNTINTNLGAGINIDLPAGTVFLGDLKQNVIKGNRGIGFNLTTTAGSFDLKVGTTDPADSNTFDRNVGAGLALNVLDTGSGSYVVQNNLFTAQQDDPLSAVFVGAGFHTRLEGTLPTVEASSILSVSRILNNTFGVDNEGNAGPGVLFGMGEGTIIDTLLVQDNTFINNRDDGFKYFRRDDADLNSVRVEDNTFEGNRGDGVELFGQNTTRDPLDWFVLRNEITNNGEYGIRIRVEADARVRAELTDNTVDFNGNIGIDPNPNRTGTVGGIGLSAFQAVQVEMPLKDNRIRGNIGDGLSIDAISIFDTLRLFGEWNDNIFDDNT